MALISKARLSQKEEIKVEVSSEVMQKIHAYCKWSQIEDIGFFIEEAACYVFAKDKEWKAFQQSLKPSTGKKRGRKAAVKS